MLCRLTHSGRPMYGMVYGLVDAPGYLSAAVASSHVAVLSGFAGCGFLQFPSVPATQNFAMH
jgi:hypothetical protein